MRRSKISGLACLLALASTLAVVSSAIEAPVDRAVAESAPSSYLALGDSYSSGEGLEPTATTYIPPSNTDGCHRSTQAYPDLVAESLGLDLSTFNAYTPGVTPPTNTFVACSGATTGDVENGFPAKDELSQIPSTVSPSVQYVTLTAGGDNLGFSGVIAGCADVTVKLSSLTYTKALSSPSTCASDIQTAQNQVFSGSSAPSSLEKTLKSLYEQILAKTPNAELFVLNYPQVFTTAPPSHFCPITDGLTISDPISPLLSPTLYVSLSPSDIQQFDLIQVGLDYSIAQAVATLRAKGSDIQLVNVNKGTRSQAFPCNTKTNDSSDINSPSLALGSSLASIFDNCVFNTKLGCNPGWKKAAEDNLVSNASFHPTKSAHQYMASLVEDAIGSQPATISTTSLPDATACQSYSSTISISGGLAPFFWSIDRAPFLQASR